MARKMPESPPEDSEGWLTSYADLMSLLSCFFMLMMAFANYDTPGVQTKAKVIAESFTKVGGGPLDQPLEKLRQEIAHHPDFDKRLKLTMAEGELRIIFAGSAVFPEGSYQLDTVTLEMVDNLIEIVKNIDADYRILVEGHADKDESLVATQMNHWSLSAARAAGVISRFEYYGFKSEYMAAVAKGDREPVSEYKKLLQAENKAPSREITKLNRRVVIRVMESTGDKNKVPRVNILFKEAEGDSGQSDLSLFKYDPSTEQEKKPDDSKPSQPTSP